MYRNVFRLLMLPVFALLVAAPVGAQSQCGTASQVMYPVDTLQFRLVQSFGSPSPRHHGRFHTGDDWYGERGATVGQPVRAIAAGRVTFSSLNGWGRDGGVVIIEHIMPDDSIVYSQYGHLTATDGFSLPLPFSCVDAGTIIGAVGDVRPAPHLHIEIKVNNPTIPGPGYTWDDPETLGWLHPRKFIRNWQAWAQPAHRWHHQTADVTGPAAPPVELDDHSLIFLDADRVRRLTADGRVLWRVNLERRATGVLPYNDSAVIVYADGGMQPVHRDGTLSPAWETGLALDGAPLLAGDLLLSRTADNALVAFDPAWQTAQWRLADVPVPPLIRWHADPQRIALITAEHDLLIVGRSGVLLEHVHLREPGALTTTVDGALLALTVGGLWQIDTSTGEPIWSLRDPVRRGERSAALTTRPGGEVYVFDGANLTAQAADGSLVWQTPMPDLDGLVEMSDTGAALLLVSTHGQIAAVRVSDGAVCGTLSIYGGDANRSWHSLGADGILRVYLADQILGLDWGTFLGMCG